jgi:hypothetical protein
MGDFSEAQDALRAMVEFSRKHPAAAITPDTIRRSMNQHMERSATMYNGVSFSPMMREAIKAKLAEWDQGFSLF